MAHPAGPSGSGKTALAATIAMASEFPFIKLISPETMVGFSETQKIAQLSKTFTDSYKSPLSVVVVDSIERLLGGSHLRLLAYRRLEPHRAEILKWRLASSGRAVWQATTKGAPDVVDPADDKGRRLLILVTTSNRSILSDMDAESAFDTDIPITPINSLEGVDHCIREVQLFPSAGEQLRAMQMLRDARLGEDGRAELLVGVKKLLSMAEMARQDPDPAFKLVSSLVREVS